MTKKTAIMIFKESYPEIFKENDHPKKQEAWQLFIDSLCRDGQITQNQYDKWGNSYFCK